MTELRWSPRAKNDFGAIVDTERTRALQKPHTYSRRIVHAIEQLRDFPFLGVESPSLGVRKLFVPATPFSVYYRVVGFEIELITIRHGAQEPLKRT